MKKKGDDAEVRCLVGVPELESLNTADWLERAKFSHALRILMES